MKYLNPGTHTLWAVKKTGYVHPGKEHEGGWTQTKEKII